MRGEVADHLPTAWCQAETDCMTNLLSAGLTNLPGKDRGYLNNELTEKEKLIIKSRIPLTSSDISSSSISLPPAIPA